MQIWPAALFVPGDGREAGCRIIDVSPVGAQVASEFVPAVGTPVVLYIEGLGRFEAEVSRIVDVVSACVFIARR